MRKWSILVIVLVLSACKNDVIFTSTHVMPNSKWTYADSLVFDFEIKDTSKVYALDLNVTHQDTFPYENLYIKVHSKYPNGIQKSDILSLEFADGSGQWMGKSSGSGYLAPIAFQPKAIFKIPGLYHMAIYQNSRKDTVGGIEKIELVIHQLGSISAEKKEREQVRKSNEVQNRDSTKI